MRIDLRNVRSFCSPQSVPLLPLTLLVGENSTGKTTFLSMLAHLHQTEFPSIRPDFNIPPFDLGTYDSIATFKGGSYGRAVSFSIGFVETVKNTERSVTATYESHKGQPQLKHLEAASESGEVFIDLNKESYASHVVVKSKTGQSAEFDLDLKRLSTPEPELPLNYLLHLGLMQFGQKKSGTGATTFPLNEFIPLVQLVRGASGPVSSLAPVRTKPRRTYDEFSDEFDPEGDHIPVLLSRLSQEDAEPDSKRLLEALNEFGAMSALYRRIGVKHFGRKPSDPFQIQVTVAGPPSNLSDVGYGVSQALPIVVQSVLAARDGLLLLQQPEVHLHPRGQAALGSLFAKLVTKEKKQLVVETHSDYLLDRIRFEVAQGNLKAESVQILFFEKQEIETVIHEIGLDDLGNVTGAPGSYRQFFLKEEENLFTRTRK
jgi:energy-coupling factor transporter ATP-binding protein EcfA2